MAKSSRPRRSKRGGNKTSSESNVPTNDSGGGYTAPTVGYEDILYSHGTTKAADLFGTVNTKLIHYISVQSWSGATIAGNAMEKLAEPTLIAPTLTSTEVAVETTEEQDVPDPDNEGATMKADVLVKKMEPKPAAIIKVKTDVYLLHYKV